MSLAVPRASFELTAGTPTTWLRTAASGNEVACVFCPTCGTRLAHFPSRNAAVVNVKPGTLDDTRWLRPVAHVWRRSAQSWVKLPDDVLAYDGQPDDFAPFLAAWTAALT